MSSLDFPDAAKGPSRNALTHGAALDTIFNTSRLAEVVGLARVPAVLATFGYTSYAVLIRYPLMYAYLFGPRLTTMGVDVGGWNGLPLEDICSRLTGVAAEHWSLHPDQCLRLLQHRVHGLEVGAGAVVYALLLYRVLLLAPPAAASVLAAAPRALARAAEAAQSLSARLSAALPWTGAADDS